MVNPLDFIPKLSGFSPMPLGIMAPFMGYQSAALAYNFGLNYEFGKRVIKSMSNEKFNKIANDPILLNELTSQHHDVLLKAFINEVPKVDKIQDLILDKMVELERKKIEMMPTLLAQIGPATIAGILKVFQDFETTPPATQAPPKSTTGGQGGKSEKVQTKPPPTQSNTQNLQNFADIPTQAQIDVTKHIQQMYHWNQKMKGVSSAVQQVFMRRAKQEATKWRNLYIKVKGYQNPTPYGTFVSNGNFNLDSRIGSLLRDWHKLL